MRSQRARAVDDELYRHMKCSLGGVALLVRLRAQLERYGADRLRSMPSGGTPELLADPSVACTLRWLEDKFGRASARRALAETLDDTVAGEVAGR